MPEEPTVTSAGGAPPPSIFAEGKPGTFAPDYVKHIPGMEPYAAMAANYPDLPTVFKTLGDNMAVARAKAGIQPLAPDATDEQRAAWESEVRKLVGVPDDGTVEAYALKPEQLPEGVEWNEDKAKKFVEVAHKLGIAPKQAAGIQEFYLAMQQEEAASQKQAWESNLQKEAETLKTTFGDKLNTVVSTAQRAALTLNIPSDVMDPKSPNFMALSSVQILQMAGKLAEALGETRLPSAAAVTTLSPKDQAADIIGNPANPLHKAFHAGDTAANATVDRLLAQK